MKSDTIDPTGAALAIVERAVTRLAAAIRDLARSHAWNDLLGTIDRLAALLGADPGPAPEPVPADFEPAEIGRFVADWVKGLMLPEYLEESAPGRALFRVRLPEEARANGLGDLADFLDSLALRLELSVEGEAARLTMAVGGADRPALIAGCALDRLDLDLDLGATRGALRHLVALAGRLPAARSAARQLELQEVSGMLRLSGGALGDGRVCIAFVLREGLRIVGRTPDGPVQVEIGSGEILAIDGEAGGSLLARVGIGTLAARMPSLLLGADEAGTAEHRVAGLGGELHATRGDRALKLRRLTLGGEPAEERHDGKVVGSVELLGSPAGFDLEPDEAGRFFLSLEGGLSLRLGAAGEELTFSAPAGTRLQMLRGRLQVEKGRLLLSPAGSASPLEVTEGRALVRRQQPRSGEPHPQLRFYESVANDR